MNLQNASRSTTGGYSTVIVAICAVLCFLPLDYQLQVTLGVALAYAVAAVGLDIAVGFTGLASLGQFAFVGMGAYLFAILRDQQGFSWPLAMAGAVIGTATVACVLACFLARLESFGFALGTFFFGFAVVAVLGDRLLEEWTGGHLGILVSPLTLGEQPVSLQMSNLIALGSLALALVVAHCYVRSRRGQLLRIVKFHDVVAHASGVRPYWVRVEALTISAAFAGLAGALLAPGFTVLLPETFSPLKSILLFAMLVVGGVGTLAGPVMGALAIVVLTQYVGSSGSYGDFLAAGAMLVFLILLPKGFVGVVDDVLKRIVPGSVRRLLERLPGRGLRPVSESVRSHVPVAMTSRQQGAALALELKDVRVQIGGVVALSQLSLQVRPSTIHAIIGPNGAGKTTLLNVASGLQRTTSGEVKVWGRSTAGSAPAKYRRLGLSRSFQHPAVVPDLTVLENVRCVVERRARAGGSRRIRVQNELAVRALDYAGLPATMHRRLGSELSLAQCKKVDIARAIAAQTPLLMLDEPTAGLEHDEMAELALTLRSLSSEMGVTILLVSHHIGFVSGLADTVTVMDYGLDIAHGPTGEVLTDGSVMEAFTGVSATAADAPAVDTPAVAHAQPRQEVLER